MLSGNSFTLIQLPNIHIYLSYQGDVIIKGTETLDEEKMSNYVLVKFLKSKLQNQHVWFVG